MSPLNQSSLKVNIAVLTVVLIAVLIRGLITHPVWAVGVYKLINTWFDESTEFNLKVHRYLLGPFKPVTDEVFNYPVEIVSGSIPADLNGLFARVGPNPIPERLPYGYHWFDGDGMIHAIRVKDGKASYTNQFIETPVYKLIKQYGSVVWPQLGELHGFIGLVKILYGMFILNKAIPLPDIENGAANTALIYYNKKILAGYEANLPFEIKWNDKTHSFQSLGFCNFHNKLKYPFSAHPKIDPEEYMLYFFGYSFDDSLAPMRYGKANENFTIQSHFDIHLSMPVMGHDMMITKNYMLVFDSSIVFDKKGILQGEFLTMHQQKLFRIGVLSKDATDDKSIKWFTFDQAFGLIHPLNAWEEPETNEIVLFTPLTRTFNSFDPRKALSKNDYQMYEVRLNLITGKVTYQLFPTLNNQEMFVEFPNVHPKYLGRKVQYGYSGELHQTATLFHQIVKYNLFDKKVEKKILLEDGWTCGEPVIIPREGNNESDNVYVAIYAVNTETDESNWIVYDGKTMDNQPVVRIRIPNRRIPLGFHGTWIHEKDLQEHMNT